MKDVDIERPQITVRRGEGDRDRAALLPAATRDALRAQLRDVGRRHRPEHAAGCGEVDLPDALRIKMPRAAKSLAWQYLFPASRACVDPATGRLVLYQWNVTAWERVERPSSMLERPRSMLERPRSMLERPSSMLERPSSMLGHPRRASSRRCRRRSPRSPPIDPSAPQRSPPTSSINTGNASEKTGSASEKTGSRLP